MDYRCGHVMSRIHAFVKETPENFLASCVMQGHSEKAKAHKALNLILECPAFRTVRNRLSTTYYCIGYSNQKTKIPEVMKIFFRVTF